MSSKQFLSSLVFACALGGMPLATCASSVDLTGVYVLNAAASDDVQAQIEKGTADMSVLIRSMARSRTLQTNPTYQRVELSHVGPSVEVRFDTRQPIHVPVDGHVQPWTREDGGRNDISGTWSATRFVMRLASPDGDRINEFTLNAGGMSMTLQVELTSPHFSAPIRYSLTYTRRTT